MIIKRISHTEYQTNREREREITMILLINSHLNVKSILLHFPKEYDFSIHLCILTFDKVCIYSGCHN